MRFSKCISLVLLVSIAGCSRSVPNADEAIEDNKKLDRRFVEAYKEKNLDAIMECIWNSTETVRYPADNIEGQWGWEEIKKGFKFQLDGIERVVAMEIVASHYFYFDGTVVGSGKIIMKIHPKGSPKQAELTIRFTDIRQKKSGSWVYVYDHESIPPMVVGDILTAAHN